MSIDIKEYTDQFKKQKSKNEIYHFHKDCAYYSQCTEEEKKEGKHKYIRFTCAMLKHSQKYYSSDLHTIKFACSKFEHIQTSLFD